MSSMMSQEQVTTGHMDFIFMAQSIMTSSYKVSTKQLSNATPLNHSLFCILLAVELVLA
jgi:hypothetical protein